jgi:pimeloyl-ACP methyl ester carboxylesterase
MPAVELLTSPLAGGAPVTIDYQQQGDGPALLFLHGGWGYDIYPIEVAALAPRATVVVPHRSGYGRSTPLDVLPPDFHRCAVAETLAVLDQLGIEQAVWWGHSDGAVIAAMAALAAPGRVRAVILEALHLYAEKAGSRSFFEQMAFEPGRFGDEVRRVLAPEHGADRWETVLRFDGMAWLELARQATSPTADLYDGRLGQISCPTLILHGGRDPRSEPGELEAIVEALPDAAVAVYPEAGHSPHSQSHSKGTVTAAVISFLARLET